MRYVKSSASYKSRSKRYRRGRKRRVTAAFAGLFLLLLVAFALRPRGHAAPVPVAHAPAPAVVARVARSAAPAWGDAARSELRRAVHSALAPALSVAGTCSCVVIAQDGSVLYDDGGSRALTPASTQKIIVADAALAQLGPQYRFDTLLATAQPPQGGTIDGDLWLEGSGDPSLRSGELRAGVAALRAAGVASVHAVAVDGSALAGEEINPLWNADDSNEDFMAATSGISIDEDTVEFHVTGTQAGEPAQVSVKPRSSAVHYYGSVQTGGGNYVIIAATQTPNEFRLDGNIPPGIEETYYLPVHGIDHYAGSVLTALLKTGGIAVADPPRTGTVPLDARILWEHRSKPLAELLKHMLVFSDNHYAEQFMRTVGAWRSGDTADDADGLSAERALLAQQGIPTPGLHIVDGSGLAHANRVAAITLARILAYYDAQPGGNVLYPLLPRGGKDGTLRMYHFAAAQGRVRAKSGHVDGVSSLVGYVDTRKHGRVVFAFLINGSAGDPDAAIVSAVDRLAER